MSDITNQQLLLETQYKNASNQQTRIQLLQQLSTNPVSIYRWLFDHFSSTPESRTLELGCGTGQLWLENQNRLQAFGTITLSDFSPAMLQATQSNLAKVHHLFTFQQIDAQSIPFEDHQLDMVIAHGVIHHIPDRQRAFSEIRRVLKPGGFFYVTAMAEASVSEQVRLLGSALPSSLVPGLVGFSNENGKEQLSGWFSHIVFDLWENTLVFTEVEAIVAWLGASMARRNDESERAIRQRFEDELPLAQEIRLKTDLGLFTAC